MVVNSGNRRNISLNKSQTKHAYSKAAAQGKERLVIARCNGFFQRQSEVIGHCVQLRLPSHLAQKLLEHSVEEKVEALFVGGYNQLLGV